MVIGTVTKEYEDGKLKSKRVERMADTLTSDQRMARSLVFIGALFLGIILELGMVFG